MYRVKNSLAALAGVLVLVAVSAILTPLVSQGQGSNPLTRDPRKSYYLTSTRHVGDQALAACAAGYHMASLWEIFDTSNLRYNTQIGFTSADAGFGPPTSYGGWIRTGFDGSGTNASPGSTNCDAWISASGTDKGTVVLLNNLWESKGGEILGPWFASPSPCDTEFRVWCVQD